MAEQTPDLGSDDVGRGGSATTGPPRWVRAFPIIAAVVTGLVIVVLLAGGGSHGPGRHSSSGDTVPPRVTADHAPPGSDLRDHGQPTGGHSPG